MKKKRNSQDTTDEDANNKKRKHNDQAEMNADAFLDGLKGDLDQIKRNVDQRNL